MIDNRLGYIRVSKGMSQLDLSKKCGISKHAISERELGKREPKLKTAMLISDALGCKIEDIFFISKKYWHTRTYVL